MGLVDRWKCSCGHVNEQGFLVKKVCQQCGLPKGAPPEESPTPESPVFGRALEQLARNQEVLYNELKRLQSLLTKEEEEEEDDGESEEAPEVIDYPAMVEELRAEVKELKKQVKKK